MISPSAPDRTGSTELRSLRDSATFISEDILNYEPPSERRARLRALNDTQNSANSLADLSSASNCQSSSLLEPGPLLSAPGTPHFAKGSAGTLPVAPAESPQGAREGEFSATLSLYTWHLKCDVPASNAAFRLTISGRTIILNVSSSPQVASNSVALMARSLTLPPDADLSELVSSFHAGEVRVQIVRKGAGANTQLSPGPVDTLALARNTQEMMAELSDMLAAEPLGCKQQPAVDCDGVASARPLSDSALTPASSSLPRSNIFSSLGSELMPTKQSRMDTGGHQGSAGAEACNEVQSNIFLDNPPEKSSEVHTAAHHPPPPPPSKLPIQQRSVAPRAPPVPQQGAPEHTPKREFLTATAGDPEKAVRAAQRSTQFFDTAEFAPTALPAAEFAASPLSQSAAPVPSEESDILKRCQDLLKRSKEQSKELLDDVAWPLTAEGQARAAYANAPSPSRSSASAVIPGVDFRENFMRGVRPDLIRSTSLPGGERGAEVGSRPDEGPDDMLSAGRMHMLGPRQSFDAAYAHLPASQSSYGGPFVRQPGLPGQPQMMAGVLGGARGVPGGSGGGMEAVRGPASFAETGRYDGHGLPAQPSAPHGQASRGALAPPSPFRDSRGTLPAQNAGGNGIVFM